MLLRRLASFGASAVLHSEARLWLGPPCFISRQQKCRGVHLRAIKTARSAGISSQGTDVPRSKSSRRRLSTVPSYGGLIFLDPEQDRVVELAATGRNIFYTGPAGCGKTTVLRAIVERLTSMGNRVHVVAPTDRAALAINGMTTWSFAGWTPDSYKRGIEDLAKLAKNNKAVRSRLEQTDVLIIDEISMVENLHFERLNKLMKAVRHNKKHPAKQRAFGGVQVIVTGDFAQLPPVKPFSHCIKCGGDMLKKMGPEGGDQGEREEEYHCGRCSITHRDSDKWAFQSKAWEECDFAYVHLDTIHRLQRDPKLISLLNKCRLGEAFTPKEVKLLMKKAGSRGTIELHSTPEEARIVNEKGIQKLTTKSYTFQCHDSFHWHRKIHPYLAPRAKRHDDGSLLALDQHCMDSVLELKIRMPVVLLVDLDMAEGLCNGSQGVIIGWTSVSKEKRFSVSDQLAQIARNLLPTPAERGKDADSEPILLIERETREFEKATPKPVWPIVRFGNGAERAIRALCQVHELGDDSPYSLLCRTQIPLAPAWAMSIHRAQGVALEKVKVDLSKAFADGQVYAALSRATSLRGLKVTGDAKGLDAGVGGNKELRLFYKNKFGR